MVDGDVFRMSEAADATESAAARVARKQTNKCRAAEELAKSDAMLQLPSNMLPMLRLLKKKHSLVAAAEEAAIATRQRLCSHLRMTRPIRTKMRATTMVLTTMMTQL